MSAQILSPGSALLNDSGKPNATSCTAQTVALILDDSNELEDRKIITPV
jgi:hypothetical protein